jgi:hypothetical protein
MSGHRVTELLIHGPQQELSIEFRTHAWIHETGATNYLTIATNKSGFRAYVTFTADQARALAADLLTFAENIEATEREAEMGGLKP